MGGLCGLAVVKGRERRYTSQAKGNGRGRKCRSKGKERNEGSE